jgi:hypothetical protein
VTVSVAVAVSRVRGGPRLPLPLTLSLP